MNREVQQFRAVGYPKQWDTLTPEWRSTLMRTMDMLLLVLGPEEVGRTCQTLVARMPPGGSGREWCDQLASVVWERYPQLRQRG